MLVDLLDASCVQLLYGRFAGIYLTREQVDRRLFCNENQCRWTSRPPFWVHANALLSHPDALSAPGESLWIRMNIRIRMWAGRFHSKRFGAENGDWYLNTICTEPSLCKGSNENSR